MAIFQFILCTTEEIIPVEVDGSPTAGEVYSATGGTGTIICGTIGDPTIGTPIYTATTLYDDCYDCSVDLQTVYTANTVYEACISCTGGTQTVILPHPVWTGLYGQTVIQGNAVQLGGINGQNS
jgi:hypothetical protein